MRRTPFFALCLAFALTASLSADNLVQNRAFDTDLSGWSTYFDSIPAWDSFGHGAAGSALIHSKFVPGNALLDAAIYQCVPVMAGHSYTYGASFWVPAAVETGQQINITLVVAWYSGASCGSGFIDNPVSGRLPVLRDNWIDAQKSLTAPAGSVSARISFGAESGFPASASAEPIQVYVDDAYFLTDTNCVGTQSHLCLGGRFLVYGDWAVPSQDRSGYMRAVPITANSGLFWFFSPDNLEVFVKVLNACTDPYNHYWVFSSGLTNVQAALHVDDTVSGETREYDNSAGTAFVPILDTSAFATCP